MGLPGSTRVYLGLPGSTLVYLGLPGSNWVYLGLPGSTWVYLGLLGSTWVYLGLSWMIEITIEHCRTLKATGGMGDGMGWMDLRVVGGIEHLAVLVKCHNLGCMTF